MARVTNLTDRTVLLHHWKVLPKGSRLLDPQGVEEDVMPDGLAYSPSGKHLADQGVLELEGYTPKVALVVTPKEEPPKEPKRRKREKTEPEQER